MINMSFSIAHPRIPFVRLCAASFALFLCLARPAVLAASDVSVPDLESRVKNTGSAVPAAALPEVPAPAPAALPENPSPAVDQPAPPASEVPAASLPDQPVDSGTGETRGLLSGNAVLGAGSPGSLSGSLFLAREPINIPGFSIDFRHDAADGYGSEAVGTGFFDRETALDVRLSGAGASRWDAALGISDRSDGFQGRNGGYYSLTSRDTDWSAGLAGIPLSGDSLTASLSGDGTIFSVFAESPGGATAPSAPVDSFAGYSMSPHISATWTRGAFSADFSGAYGYETVAGLGEYHQGEGTLSLGWNPGSLSLAAGVSVAGDSTDGLAVPFRLSAAWSRGEGLIRFAHLSGGLDRAYCSTRLLAADEPFVDRNVSSVHAADWTVSAGFAVNPVEALSLTADADFRKTAFSRGVLVLTDSLDAAGLVSVSRVERESLETSAAAVWTAAGLRASCGYSREWLDRLWRESLHRLTVEASLFDQGEYAVWELSADGSVSLDGAETPILGADASYRPVPNLSLTLSLDDSVCLFSGADRKRNGLYTGRSGSLSASARIDF